MAEKIKVIVNGKEVYAAYDTPLLQVCREAGADVPTLCHNENINPPYGVCRVCTVEITEGTRTRFAPSCVYPVRREISVQTESEPVRRRRAMLLNFLLARCPDQKPIQELAARYGVKEPHPRFTRRGDDCILCGLCVQTCTQVVGVSALGFESRGEMREAATPYRAENPVCIACGACAYICPTQCIGFEEKDGKRYLKRWKREAPMLVCEKCGSYWLPEAVARIVGEKMNIDFSGLNVCPNCR